MRTGFAVLIPLLVGLASAAGCARGIDERRSRATLAPAAATNFRDVVLSDLAGHPMRLGQAAGNRPALISFWAPWCEPCVREQPVLQRLARQARACGAGVVGVAVGENRDAISRFTHDRQLDFPQLIDQEFHLSDALGQRHIPATLVLDADEKVIFSGEGLDTRAVAALQKAIASAGLGADCSLR